MTDRYQRYVRELTPLLKAFRSSKGPPNLLALECFLLCAEKPRTVAELMALTGLSNARINNAIRTLTPWFDPKTGEVVRPAMHLLQRRRTWGGQRCHRMFVTAAGRRLLEGSY
jgi:hypothetical protein